MARRLRQWTGLKIASLGAGLFFAGGGCVLFGWDSIGHFVMIFGWLMAVVGIALTFVWVARNERK
jgi:hypothetical protein